MSDAGVSTEIGRIPDVDKKNLRPPLDRALPKRVKIFHRRSSTSIPEGRTSSVQSKMEDMPLVRSLADVVEFQQWFSDFKSNASILTDQLDSGDKSLIDNGLFCLKRLASSKGNIEEWVCTLLEGRSSHVEDAFLTSDSYKRLESLELLSTLAIYGNDVQKRDSLAFLDSQKKTLWDGLRVPNDGASYGAIMGKLYVHGINIFDNDGKSIDDIYGSISSQIDKRYLIANLLNSRKDTVSYRKGLVFLSEQLAQYGLSGDEFLRVWEMGSHLNLDQQIAKNLFTIHNLEKMTSGSVAELARKFGIRHFGRYDQHMLLAQYENRDRKDKPYGIILNPYADYNDGFTGDFRIFSELYDNTAYDFNIRIVECYDTDEIRQRLQELNDSYGDSHKIAFAIIGGHGEKQSIQFGNDGEKSKLRVEDLKGKDGLMSKSGEFFEDNPTIILNSCSTGKSGIFKQGIGKTLHKVLGATVFAPDRPTSIQTLSARLLDGKISFDVEYWRKNGANTTVVYRA